MRTALYPGSFNPWHDGHTDVLQKIENLFDRVIVAQGINPQKNNSLPPTFNMASAYLCKVQQMRFGGLIVDFIKELESQGVRVDAIVRGLRNGADLDFEKAQQYWNEDLGLKIPTLYVVTDRTLVHMSSTAIRMVEKLKK